MTTITVLPQSAMQRAERLLTAAGWEGTYSGEWGDDAEAAVSLARDGRPALFIPEGIDVPGRLRRIVVVHEGGRGDRAGIDAANEAAVASRAEVIVLYVPSTMPSATSGSLPFRMADHAAYDWGEWRDEFLRRFCRCSEGVEVTLHVGAGSTVDLREQISNERPDLLISSVPSDADGGAAIDGVLGVPAPVLLMPSVGTELLGAARRGPRSAPRSEGAGPLRTGR